MAHEIAPGACGNPGWRGSQPLTLTLNAKKGVLTILLTGNTKSQWGEALSGAGKCDWMFSHANRVVK